LRWKSVSDGRSIALGAKSDPPSIGSVGLRLLISTDNVKGLQQCHAKLAYIHAKIKKLILGQRIGAVMKPFSLH
jgi:hypothetical protein